MHTDVPNHEPGLLIMHSGVQQPTRPSMGSWVSYGLGSENANLPSFVVLTPRHPVVGPQLWSSSFLPGAYQGMAVDTNDLRVDRLVANLRHPTLGRDAQLGHAAATERSPLSSATISPLRTCSSRASARAAGAPSMTR